MIQSHSHWTCHRPLSHRLRPTPLRQITPIPFPPSRHSYPRTVAYSNPTRHSPLSSTSISSVRISREEVYRPRPENQVPRPNHHPTLSPDRTSPTLFSIETSRPPRRSTSRPLRLHRRSSYRCSPSNWTRVGTVAQGKGSRRRWIRDGIARTTDCDRSTISSSKEKPERERMEQCGELENEELMVSRKGCVPSFAAVCSSLTFATAGVDHQIRDQTTNSRRLLEEAQDSRTDPDRGARP